MIFAWLSDFFERQRQRPSLFPNLSNPTATKAHRLRPLAHADGTIAKIMRLPGQHPPEPKTLQQALTTRDARAWSTVYNVELARHVFDLRAWYFDDELTSDKPLP